MRAAVARGAPRAIDVFLRYLKAEGVSVVFGIPGGLLHPFFEVIEGDPDLELIVTKHEEGAAFMADGYARVSRRLSVCGGTSGPGATNMITGVACAFADGVPMLVVTGQVASHMFGKGAAQETSREDMDIVAMFRPITKYSAMVTSSESMAQHLRRALRQALSGRPGPVHLNVPVDLWERPLAEAWFDPKTYRPDTRTFDRAAVQRAAAHLMSAKRPVLFAGAGVGIAGAEEHLRSLAELLPARVATTPRGKGLFPEDHDLSLGVMGFAGHAAAREVLLGDGPDVLLTVGTSLNETATLNWTPELRKNRVFMQLDIDSDRIGRNYPVDIALVGDAQTVLVEIVYHLHRLMREGARPASTWAAEPKAQRIFSSPELRDSDQVPLTPQRWRRDLEEVLPDDAIIFSDIGGHMLSNIHYLTIRERQKFVLNLGFGSMGHGTAAPVGAALAEKGDLDRREQQHARHHVAWVQAGGLTRATGLRAQQAPARGRGNRSGHGALRLGRGCSRANPGHRTGSATAGRTLTDRGARGREHLAAARGSRKIDRRIRRALIRRTRGPRLDEVRTED